MPKAIDPLMMLREHIQQGKKIERKGNLLVFSNGLKLPLDTPTACKQQHTEKQYSLGSIWLYLINKDDTLAAYMGKANKEKIETITLKDKKSILDFFINSVDDVEIIDADLRPKTMVMLGRKKEGDDLEMMMEEEEMGKTSQIKVEGNEVGTGLVNKSKELLEPNLIVMDYLSKMEKRTVNRNSILRSFTSNYSFENLLKICQKHFTKTKHQEKGQEQTSFLEELLSGESDLSDKKAIIVVPNKFVPGNLCLGNAREFLVDAKYVELEPGREYRPTKSFKRSIKGKEVNFEIHDDVRKFEKSDWKRVIAVFVQGVEWEFKDWPKSETIISILLKIKGFHLKYNDSPLNENCRKWNLKILEIHRSKRHFDGSVNNEFWSAIEEFLNLPRYREKNHSRTNN